MKVREITPDEVAFYRENGWVKLPGLIDRETIAAIAEPGREMLAEHHKDSDGAPFFQVCRHMAADNIEPYKSFALDETLSRNAERLLDRERLIGHRTPVLLRADSLSCKWRENGPTSSHEDYAGHALDRAASLTMWIALDKVTPEMGTMRFLSKAFREGPFGHVLNVDPVTGEVVQTSITDQYPGLTDLYDWSDWQSYEPGDATVHHCFTIHEAGPNTTDRGRYNYVLVYSTGDALIRDNPIMCYHSQDRAKYLDVTTKP